MEAETLLRAFASSPPPLASAILAQHFGCSHTPPAEPKWGRD